MRQLAVIGHGRSPEGQLWGSRIDCCDTVIRMWDCDWQPIPDYGTKYDYGLFSITPKGMTVWAKHNVRKPTRGWLGMKGKPTNGKLPELTRVVDPAPWEQAARDMGAAGLSGKLTLTRGCMAACWAITQAGHPDNRGEVVLVGFDNVKCGINQPIEQSFSPVCWDQYKERFPVDKEKFYPIGGAKTATHDMKYEWPLLRFLADNYGVRVRFAQDIWR